MLHNGGSMRDSFQLLCISNGMKNIFIIAIFIILSGLIASKVTAQLSTPAEIPTIVEPPKEDTSATIPTPSPDPTVPANGSEQSGPIDAVPPVVTSPAPTEIPPVIAPTAPPVQVPQSGGYRPPSGTLTTGNSGSIGGSTNSVGSVGSTGGVATQYSYVYPTVAPTLSTIKSTQNASNQESTSIDAGAVSFTTPTPTSQPIMASISNDPPSNQSIPQQIEMIIKSTGSSIPVIGKYIRKPAFAYYPNNQLSTQETAWLLGLSLISFIAGLSLVSSRFPRFIFNQMAVIKSFIL